MRGPAVARWLYDDPLERGYGDVDLLVAPGDYAAAGAILRELEFVDTSANMRADEQHPNESHWMRMRDGNVVVDLHHSLSLIDADPPRTWRVLTRECGRLTLAGVQIETPSEGAHLVLLAAHAAHHGPEPPKPVADLARAVARVGRPSWEAAAAIAGELGAAGVMREGLKLVDGGPEFADALGLADDATRLVRLQARTPPPTSSGIERLLATRGWRGRIALLASRFFPSPSFMRQWKGLARSGPAGLALAYLWRPLWLLWHAPRGLAAWVAAALPRERRARVPAFLAGARWGLRAWWRCRRQLRRGGLQAVALSDPPADLPGAVNGVRRALDGVHASCLQRSLVLQHWESSHGNGRDVIIGVRGGTSKFGAHAWLDGEPQEPGVFTELKRWPPQAKPKATVRPELRLVPPPADLAIDPTTLGEVAIVHDYLNQRGGAEKVVLELADIWPAAPIYTSLYRPESTFREFGGHEIYTSPLDHLPVDARFRSLFPLYPGAFRALGPIDADVVISSSSGWAHMVQTTARALHVVYCYTPARWLYRDDYMVAGEHFSWREKLIVPVSGAMRRVDRRAARRADLYIAISSEVRSRIAQAYGLESEVIYPPVDVERFTPLPRGERLLAIARLLPYKRVDLVIRAAERLGLGLDIVGDGPMLDALRGIAGESVTFHRSVSEAAVADLLENCRAVCVAGEEDFGIVAVEAQAAGKPVIAYARGGALETVTEGITGILFEQQTEDSIVAAIEACEAIDTPPEVIATYAERFSRETFRRRLVAVIDEHLRAHA
jgi:glycosyltransferase involved in cell wall biosynthesis